MKPKIRVKMNYFMYKNDLHFSDYFTSHISFFFFFYFVGLGFLMVMLSFVVTWYILVVLMWTLYFLYSSFFPVLPWTTCDNWWNTEKCRGNVNSDIFARV